MELEKIIHKSLEKLPSNIFCYDYDMTGNNCLINFYNVKEKEKYFINNIYSKYLRNKLNDNFNIIYSKNFITYKKNGQNIIKINMYGSGFGIIKKIKKFIGIEEKKKETDNDLSEYKPLFINIFLKFIYEKTNIAAKKTKIAAKKTNIAAISDNNDQDHKIIKIIKIINDLFNDSFDINYDNIYFSVMIINLLNDFITYLESEKNKNKNEFLRLCQILNNETKKKIAKYAQNFIEQINSEKQDIEYSKFDKIFLFVTNKNKMNSFFLSIDNQIMNEMYARNIRNTHIYCKECNEYKNSCKACYDINIKNIIRYSFKTNVNQKFQTSTDNDVYDIITDYVIKYVKNLYIMRKTIASIFYKNLINMYEK